MEIRTEYSLKNLNTFGVEAQARWYAEFHSIEELQSLLAHPAVKNVPKMILGGGSNILFTRDYPGIILHNRIKGIQIAEENEKDLLVKAGGGDTWHDLVLYAVGKNAGGIENLSLIPGTAGAAPIQNIGAYGVELKDTFESLEALAIETGEQRVFTAAECEFGYRDSVFKRHLKGKYIITSITLRLSKTPVFNTSYGAIAETLRDMGVTDLSVKAVSEAVCHIRRSKLPDPAILGNAGSFFKNPEIDEQAFEALKARYPDIPSFKTVPGKVKVPAGWLNEQCGWKGKIIGDTGVHKHQALVLVNYGNARGEEIKKLAEAIQRSVLQKFGIALETEVNIL